MNDLKQLYDKKQLAVVQGVGYPNPDRSHFESMDIWQLADPKRAQTNGWLARAIPGMNVNEAGVPGMFIGQDRLPVAMQGADGGVISLADRESFHLKLSGNEKPRKKLLEDLNSADDGSDLAAKAVAGSWGLPLLRLDIGTLYNKFYGETEKNLRQALAAADGMAPCVLWIDEIEKGISTESGDGEGGVSRRMLGTLLTWMAERRSRVFLVATANDITSLPPSAG